MLHSSPAPDHVSRLDFLYWASPFLCPANVSGYEQMLSFLVDVPGGPGAWLEGDIRTGKGSYIVCRKRSVNGDIAGKIPGRPLY